MSCPLWKNNQIKHYETRNNEPFCEFCVEFVKNNQSNVKEVSNINFPQCSCDVFGNYESMKLVIENFFKNFDEMPIQKIQLMNLLLGNQNIVEKIFETELKEIKNDMDYLNKDAFRWVEYEIEVIKQKIRFAQLFTLNSEKKMLHVQASKVFYLNTSVIESMITMDYLQKIMAQCNKDYGSNIYNLSQIYNTHLLQIFIKYIFIKDFCLLDKIKGTEIEYLTPLTRVQIRKKNRNNKYIQEKYFNENFNIFNWVMNMIKQFCPLLGFLFMEVDHLCHEQAIYITKYLVETGLLDNDQLVQLMKLLYLKLDIFVQLENFVEQIEKDKALQFLESFKRIRRYIAEILINITYQRQDSELLQMINNVDQKVKYWQNGKSINKIQQQIDFSNTVVFQEELGYVLLQYTLGYLFRQNCIHGQTLITPQLLKISDNFMKIFTHIDDPYLLSLQIAQERDIHKYIYLKSNNGLEDCMTKFSQEIDQFLDNYKQPMNFDMLQNNKSFLNKSLQQVLSSFKYSTTYKVHDQIFNDNILNKLFNILVLLQEKEDLNSQIQTQIKDLVIYACKEDSEMLSVMITQKNLFILQSLQQNNPLLVIDIMYDAFKNDSRILVQNIYTMQIFLKNFTNLFKTQPNNHIVLVKLLKFLQLYLNSSEIQHELRYFPDYDKIIFEELVNIVPEFLTQNNLKELLQNEIFQKDSSQAGFTESQISQYEYIYNFLKILIGSINYRFTYDNYEKFIASFTQELLIDWIEITRKSKICKLFYQLLQHLFIDFKDKLLNKRYKYQWSNDDIQNKSFISENVEQSDEIQVNKVKIIDKFENKNRILQKLVNDVIMDKVIAKKKNLKLNKTQTFGVILDYESEMPEYNDLIFYEKKPAYQNMLTFLAKSINNNIIGYNDNKINTTLFEDFKLLYKMMNQFCQLTENDQYYLRHLQSNLLYLNQILFLKKDYIKNILKIKDYPVFMSKQETVYSYDNIEPQSKRNYKILQHLTIQIVNLCEQVLKKEPTDNPFVLLKQNQISKTTLTEDILQMTDPYSTRMKDRILANQQYQTKLYMETDEKEFDLNVYIYKSYILFKMQIMSNESSNNIYLQKLKHQDQDALYFCKNFCHFIINQFNLHVNKDNELDWNYRLQSFFLIQSLSNLLFFDVLWQNLITTFNFVIGKNIFDKIWDESYQKLLVMIKFHQYLVEDNNNEFRNFFQDSMIFGSDNKADTRLKKLVKLIDILCTKFVWTSNFHQSVQEQFKSYHREQLFPICTYLIDLVTEIINGNNIESKLQVYTILIKHFIQLLSRFTTNADSHLYKIKLAVLDFMSILADSFFNRENAEKIQPMISFCMSMFELQFQSQFMQYTLCQILYLIVLKKPLDHKLRNQVFTKQDFEQFQFQMKFNTQNINNHPMIQICVRLYTYQKKISDLQSEYNLYFKERDEALQNYNYDGTIQNHRLTEMDILVYSFLQQYIIYVEIIDDNDKLQLYYFEKKAMNKFLTKATKKKFWDELTRTSIEDKINDIFMWYPYFKFEMNYFQNLKRPLLQDILDFISYESFEKILWFSCFVINCLIIYDFKTTEVGNYNFGLKQPANILSIINIIVSSCLFLQWIHSFWPYHAEIALRDYLEQNPDIQDIDPYTRWYLKNFRSLLQPQLLVFLTHFICNICGLVSGEFFYGLELVTIINIHKTAYYVIQSMTGHLSQLINTYVLALIIMFSYAQMNHMFFFETFYDQQSCESLYQCFFTVINIAFSNGSGITVNISSENGLQKLESFQFYNRATFFAQMFMSLTFFLLINTIITNIFLGIIIDTFTEQREKQDLYAYDSQDVCSICGLDRTKFEKYDLDFDDHIQNQHNLWKYISMLIYFDNKTIKDCNTLESELIQKILNDDYSWIPIGRSLNLESKQPLEASVSINNLKEMHGKLKDALEQVLSRQNQ